MQMAVNNGVINQINSKSAPLNESARQLSSPQQTKLSLTFGHNFCWQKKILEISVQIQILQNHGRYMRKVNI